jgi:hypothetical protein
MTSRKNLSFPLKSGERMGRETAYGFLTTLKGMGRKWGENEQMAGD